jgi:hypothetical protein
VIKYGEQAVLHHTSAPFSFRFLFNKPSDLVAQATLHKDQPALYCNGLLVTGGTAWTSTMRYRLPTAESNRWHWARKQEASQLWLQQHQSQKAQDTETVSSAGSAGSMEEQQAQEDVQGHMRPVPSSTGTINSTSSSSSGSNSKPRKLRQASDGTTSSRSVVSDWVVEVSPQQLEEAGYGEAKQLLAPLVGKSPQKLEACLPQVLPRLAAWLMAPWTSCSCLLPRAQDCMLR